MVGWQFGFIQRGQNMDIHNTLLGNPKMRCIGKVLDAGRPGIRWTMRAELFYYNITQEN